MAVVGAGGGFFGGGAKTSDQTGANTINPNQGTQASETSAPIISFQSNISTSGKNAQVVGGGSPNVTVNSTTTDFGALAAGSNLATQGINLAGATLNLQAAQLDNIAEITKNANATVADVSKSGLDNALSFGEKAFNFASESQGNVLNTFKSALGDVFDYTQNLVGDVITANQKSTQQTITGLTDLSARTTTSSDQRVQEIAKYAIYAAVAIAAAFVLAPVLRGAK